MRACRPANVVPAPSLGMCTITTPQIDGCAEARQMLCSGYDFAVLQKHKEVVQAGACSHLRGGRVCVAFSSEILLHGYPSHSLQTHALPPHGVPVNPRTCQGGTVRIILPLRWLLRQTRIGWSRMGGCIGLESKASTNSADKKHTHYLADALLTLIQCCSCPCGPPCLTAALSVASQNSSPRGSVVAAPFLLVLSAA